MIKTEFSIGINPNESELGIIQTEFSIKINPNESEVKNRSGLIRFNLRKLYESEFGLIRIENLVSDWFGFIRIVASD